MTESHLKGALDRLVLELGLPTKDSPWRNREGPPASSDIYQPSAPELDLTPAEVKQLWWFFDGSVNTVETRHHLWDSWGFCPRHTWAFAIASLEMRGTFFQPSVLYEDLVGRAARSVAHKHRRGAVANAMKPGASCLTCDYCATARTDPGFVGKTDLVNQREEFSQAVARLAPIWQPRSCPECLGGDGPPCRPHLLAGRAEPPDDLADRLAALHRRLDHFHRSMTWQGPEATDEDQASIFEVLGFFAGWQVLALVLEHAPSTRRRSAKPRDLRWVVENADDPYIAIEALRTLIAGTKSSELAGWLRNLADDHSYNPSLRHAANQALEEMKRN